MDRPHVFIPYPVVNGRPVYASCVRCGRPKDAPIHKEKP